LPLASSCPGLVKYPLASALDWEELPLWHSYGLLFEPFSGSAGSGSKIRKLLGKNSFELAARQIIKLPRSD
jgi:hypothetical protein